MKGAGGIAVGCGGGQPGLFQEGDVRAATQIHEEPSFVSYTFRE